MLNLGIEDCSADLNKDYSWDEKQVKSLRQRLIDDETLTSRTDDAFLLSFLRARKFDEDDAFKYIKKYYVVRKRFPAIFKNFVPSALQEFLEMNCVGYLKKTEENGCAILIAVCRCWDPSRVTIWDAFRGFMLLLDSLLTENLVQANGVIFILDYTQASWKQLIDFTPSFVYALISCLFGSYPARYKQIHSITDWKIAHWISIALLPFLPKKIKERMYIHSTGLESLHKMINQKYLPVDYGGEMPSFDPSDCYKKLRENEWYFKESETYWTDKENK